MADLFHLADKTEIHFPLSHEPMARPNMKTDRTVDSTGVITPNAANASRSHTIWYRRLQKPERMKATNKVRRKAGTERDALPSKLEVRSSKFATWDLAVTGQSS